MAIQIYLPKLEHGEMTEQVAKNLNKKLLIIKRFIII